MAKSSGKRSRSSGPSGGGPIKKAKISKARKGSSTLGRIAGKVSPGNTTLARSIGPFAERKFVTLEYKNAATTVGSANFLSLPVALNSAYDFDKTSGNYFGNKQPLYYDTLLTSSGPYKTYKVISWTTTYTIMNTGNIPLQVWALPPTGATAEIDSAAEADNFPGVQAMVLTPVSGSKCMGSVTVKGHINDVYPSYDGAAFTLTSLWNSDPTSLVYGGLCLYYIDGTTAIAANVSVKHEMYTELGLVDSLVS